MWIKTHSTVTKEVTAEQMWKLFSDVNNWYTWDTGIESAKLVGPFEQGWAENNKYYLGKGNPGLSLDKAGG